MCVCVSDLRLEESEEEETRQGKPPIYITRGRP